MTLCLLILSFYVIKVVVKYTGIAVHSVTLQHRYGNSHAICDHTVLPATQQR